MTLHLQLVTSLNAWNILKWDENQQQKTNYNLTYNALTYIYAYDNFMTFKETNVC